MATRDRTRLFVAYRQSCVHHPVAAHSDEHCGLLGDAVELDWLAPDWSACVGEVERLLQEISGEREALERLYKKNMLPGFDDRRHDEGEAQWRCMRVLQGFRRCQDLIRTVVPRHGATPTEAAIARNVQTALANKVQAENMLFKKKQSLYLQQLHRGSGHTGALTDTYGKSVPKEEGVPITGRGVREGCPEDGQMLVVQRESEEEIARRERDIMDIAKRILELSDIFKEIQSVVTDQGSILDTISTNIENTGESMCEASKELSKVSEDGVCRH